MLKIEFALIKQYLETVILLFEGILHIVVITSLEMSKDSKKIILFYVKDLNLIIELVQKTILYVNGYQF